MSDKDSGEPDRAAQFDALVQYLRRKMEKWEFEEEDEATDEEGEN